MDLPQIEFLCEGIKSLHQGHISHARAFVPWGSDKIEVPPSTIGRVAKSHHGLNFPKKSLESLWFIGPYTIIISQRMFVVLYLKVAPHKESASLPIFHLQLAPLHPHQDPP